MLFSEERCYRPDEVAVVLNISVRSVYRRIEEGDIEAVKVCGVIRIEGKELNGYLEKVKMDPLGTRQL